eukprot:Nitzschia sp. Nitz4//scaffold24_size164493//125203//126420//NITZ4_002345-RA/size164493-processed-gene-0.210-mRNA-1//1//CDS//3329544165//7738//frame0
MADVIPSLPRRTTEVTPATTSSYYHNSSAASPSTDVDSTPLVPPTTLTQRKTSRGYAIGRARSGDLFDLVRNDSSTASTVQASPSSTGRIRRAERGTRRRQRHNSSDGYFVDVEECVIRPQTPTEKIQKWSLAFIGVMATFFLLFGLLGHKHYQLHSEHNEFTSMYKDMKVASYSKDVRDSLALANNVAIGREHSLRHMDTSMQRQYMRMARSLLTQISTLKETVADTARNQLLATFPDYHAEGASTIRVELGMEGMPSPLVLAINHLDLPYTAWAWLDQVRRGHWDKSQLTHVHDEYFEFRTSSWAEHDTPVEARVRSAVLEFEEQSIPVHQPYVIGLRNSDEGSEHGFVLSIHLEAGTCGKMDETEICFGKLVGGFDTLSVIQSIKRPLNVRSTRVPPITTSR